MKAPLNIRHCCIPLLLVLLLHTQCEPPSTALPQTCLRVEKLRGDRQFGQTDEVLGTSLIARVRDQSGQPRAGVPVTWTATGGGEVVAVNDRTSVSGDAEAIYALGAGNEQKVVCRIAQPFGNCSPDSSSVEFTATRLSLAAQTPTVSVQAVNASGCGTQVLYSIPVVVTNLFLKDYYIEVEQSGTGSNGQQINYTNQASGLTDNAVQLTVCVTFGPASWIETSSRIKLYGVDAQGRKAGPALIVSNQTARVRLNRPAGAARRSSERGAEAQKPSVSGG